MQKTIYQDYKYCMQDTSRVYIGCKYTFREVMTAEDVPFKLRFVFQKYVITDEDKEDTLETHLYYLKEDSFLVEYYKQMKARIKVNLIEEKKSLFGKKKKVYVSKKLKIEQLVEMKFHEKEACGLVIQEFSASKLALMGM